MQSLEVILDMGLPCSAACGTCSHILKHENQAQRLGGCRHYIKRSLGPRLRIRRSLLERVLAWTQRRLHFWLLHILLSYRLIICSNVRVASLLVIINIYMIGEAKAARLIVIFANHIDVIYSKLLQRPAT